MQQVCIQCGKSNFPYLTICNSVRQGGILSPRLFTLYVNQLTNKLLLSKLTVILMICSQTMYDTDDICSLAPSATVVQSLLDACYKYGN